MAERLTLSHKFICRYLSIPQQQAFVFAEIIEDVRADIELWAEHVFRYLIIALLVLALITVAHLFWMHMYAKSLSLFALGVGLVGTLMWAYGFAFYHRGLAPQDPSKVFSIPEAATKPEDTARYASRLNEFLAAYIGSEVAEHVRESKLGLRRNLSLLLAMMLIGVGFVIQMILQFL